MVTLILCFLVTMFLTIIAYWHKDRVLYIIDGVAILTLAYLFMDTNKAISGALYALWIYTWIAKALMRR